jgi:hypothetical protein
MAVTINGTTGITTPDITSDSATIDSTTLVVDETNNRIGIGTATPQNELDVNGSIRISLDGGVIGNGDEKIKFDETGQTIQFQTADSEAMRIDSTGRVLIATTTEPSAAGDNGISLADAGGRAYFARSAAGTGGTVVVAYGGLGECQIRGDGDLNNTNGNYGSISDARLKENIVDANSQWDDIKALQIKNYNLIAYPDRTMLGVIAQDLEASGMSGLVVDSDIEYWEEGHNLPEGVSVGDVKKESHKTVKYSILYMKAVKALHEAMDRIETLETKVATLEANNV